MNRRQFLFGSLGVLGAAASALAGYSTLVEPAQVRLERVTVSVPFLPTHLDGYTIGVLADLHLGPLVPVERAEQAAAILAGQSPDLVVVAGDMISDVDAVELVDRALAPVKGAYGVLGNWDVRGSSRGVRRQFPVLAGPGGDPASDLGSLAIGRQRAVRLLVNEGALMAPDLWVGGVDDGIWGRPDIDRALAGAPEGVVRILLAHEPDLADMVRPEHRVTLQISGHSHGGQVWLPFIGPLLLPPLGRKYHTGLNRAPSCTVYTSRGVGVAHLPIRFLCPPEVTLITLRRSS